MHIVDIFYLIKQILSFHFTLERRDSPPPLLTDAAGLLDRVLLLALIEPTFVLVECDGAPSEPDPLLVLWFGGVDGGRAMIRGRAVRFTSP